VSVEDQESIKMVIQEYFNRRYFVFSILNHDGIPDTYFDDLLSAAPETSDYLTLELVKLRMSLKHAELNFLKYAAYEYFLDYENISLDESGQQASVVLSKRENIIFDISVILASGEPIMSRGSGEKHTILVRKEEGEWKIVSDTYRDYVWRMLRKSNASADEILNTLDSMLRNMEAAPLPSSLGCFLGDFSSYISIHYPESEGTPCAGSGDSALLIQPEIRHIFVNGKYYDPAWLYSNPFINLFFQSDGYGPLRFIVELEDLSLNQFLSCDIHPEILGWQIMIYPHPEGQNEDDPPIFVLDLDQKLSCDSRPAFYSETTLEDIQEELGNRRAYDYQVVNGKGEIQLEHSFYLNPAGEYLISDTFGDVTGLDGGIIGYPNLLGESKAVFPHQGRVITVHEPRGGFYQLHYFAKPAIRWYTGLFTAETPYEIIIQIFIFREDGNYNPEQAFIIPENRKIKERRNFDFEVVFTFEEVRDALGQGNAFYVRFLDKDGNIVGEDYFYFVPYTSPTP